MINRRGFILVLLCIVITGLFVLAFKQSSGKDEQADSDAMRYTDTLTIVVHDTVKIEKLVEVEKRVVDTVYVDSSEYKSGYGLELIQKHYKERDRYDLWISGIEPLGVDSIHLYDKIEYRDIIKYETRYVNKDVYSVYAGGGLSLISRTLTPYVSVSLSTPNKTLVTLNMGHFQGGYIYALDFKFNILSK